MTSQEIATEIKTKFLPFFAIYKVEIKKISNDKEILKLYVDSVCPKARCPLFIGKYEVALCVVGKRSNLTH